MNNIVTTIWRWELSNIEQVGVKQTSSTHINDLMWFDVNCLQITQGKQLLSLQSKGTMSHRVIYRRLLSSPSSFTKYEKYGWHIHANQNVPFTTRMVDRVPHPLLLPCRIATTVMVSFLLLCLFTPFNYYLQHPSTTSLCWLIHCISPTLSTYRSS